MSKKPSFSELAYTELRRRILTLEYKPGTRLDDYEISAELKCSRTPVREAMFRLGAEGWVDAQPKVGFVVRSLDIQNVAQLFEAHGLIAGLVGRLAAQRVTESELKEMRAVAAEIREAIERGDRLTMTAKNAELHRLEGRATRNDIIASCATSIHDQSERLAYLCYGGDQTDITEPDLSDHLSKVVHDHDAMIDALERRDEDAAEEVALRHVHLFRTRVQEYLVRDLSVNLGGLTAKAHSLLS
ncbi:GntR family transcriptional regulator [Streptomyces sp. NPDC058045]|uniref:GntR family transcriptional regulator n=1 Tax=Streptomyces sp. NPDC058045 TaxID=3346311 RepID=UPI0036F132C0